MIEFEVSEKWWMIMRILHRTFCKTRFGRVPINANVNVNWSNDSEKKESKLYRSWDDVIQRYKFLSHMSTYHSLHEYYLLKSLPTQHGDVGIWHQSKIGGIWTIKALVLHRLVFLCQKRPENSWTSWEGKGCPTCPLEVQGARPSPVLWFSDWYYVQLLFDSN